MYLKEAKEEAERLRETVSSNDDDEEEETNNGQVSSKDNTQGLERNLHETVCRQMQIN